MKPGDQIHRLGERRKHETGCQYALPIEVQETWRELQCDQRYPKNEEERCSALGQLAANADWSRGGLGSCAGIRGLSQESSGSQDQDGDQQAEADRVAVTGIDKPRNKVLYNAKENGGQYRAANVAEAAENHNNKRFERKRVADYRREGIDHGDQRAGRTPAMAAPSPNVEQKIRAGSIPITRASRGSWAVARGMACPVRDHFKK